MKLASYQALVLGILLVLSTGCRDAVRPGVEPPAVQPPPVTTGFPPLSHPGDIYLPSEKLAWDLRAQDPRQDNIGSRYVIYEDGSFGLQSLSVSAGFHEYSGEHVRVDSVIALDFNARNNLGPWDAIAVVRGDSLLVEYNVAMSWHGFIDGVYVRSPEAP